MLKAQWLAISIKSISLLILLILFFIGLSLFRTYAVPQGGEIVAGDITITNPAAGQTLINQATQSGIINWQSFGIGHGEHTHFQQPSTSAVTLNRVIGPDASHILGRLSATGIIMLVNQAGIFFGPSSVVDVAGLIATTSNISDADFLAGTYRFLQTGNPTASIIARGQINVAQEGIVALMAPGVEHTGVITANLGKVVLGSVAQGSSYVVDLYGDNLVHFSVRNELVNAPRNQNNEELSAAVSHTGEIYAHGGKVLLTARAAKDIVHSVINTSGIIEANTVSEHRGEIYLDAGSHGVARVAGTLRARGEEPGETGGNITVLGDVITIAENIPAILDVSGSSGGGEIFIGGGFQGGGTLPHSTITYISPEAQLFANALIEGEGGLIVAWSSGYTGAHGTFEAMGGALGGSGGLVETSGHYLSVAGMRLNLSAINGDAGTLLLDPWDVTISNNASVPPLPGGDWSGGSPNVWTHSVLNSNVQIGPVGTPGTLLYFLDGVGNVNVIIQTTMSGNGDIIVQDPITWTSSNFLELLAYRHVVVDAAITGNGDLFLTAGVTDPAGTVKINQPIIVNNLIVNTVNNAAIEIKANVTTSGGSQFYNDPITLTGNAVLSGAQFNPSGAIAGGGFDLELNFSGESIDIVGNAIEGVTFSNIGTLTIGTGGVGSTNLTGTVNQANISLQVEP
jgi:filamentous hemagglutinin family protein